MQEIAVEYAGAPVAVRDDLRDSHRAILDALLAPLAGKPSRHLSAVNAPSGRDGGVAHGAKLLAFTDAVMGADDGALARERGALRAVLSDEAFVDTCAVVGTFNVVDRIADATGIPLDAGMAAMSGDERKQLDLARFASSANTPGA